MGPGCRLLDFPVLIYLIEIAALLDCSATHNFISSGLVELILLLSSVGPSLIVTMANTLVVLIYIFVTVPLRFGPSLQLIRFQVLLHLSTPIVLRMLFLETINPMVDWISKSITWIDNGQYHTLRGKQWLNSGLVQLVSLEAFYQCMQDTVCTGSWKVWIKL